MKTSESLRPRSGVVAREMNGSAVLVHLDTNRIYELNETGARIWALLSEGLGRSELCARLSAEFGVSGPSTEREVDELLAELTREGLIGG
jgi:hypothetical protein